MTCTPMILCSSYNMIFDSLNFVSILQQSERDAQRCWHLYLGSVTQTRTGKQAYLYLKSHLYVLSIMYHADRFNVSSSHGVGKK